MPLEGQSIFELANECRQVRREDSPIPPNPFAPNSASKHFVLVNFLQALLAIVLGNLAYFLLAAHFGLPRHRPFQPDAGLLVDFFICLVFYVLIRQTRKK